VSDYLDRYGRAKSLCHRLPPRVKLLASLAAIAAGMALPPAHWPAHGALLCVLFAAMSLARIPFWYVARRLTGFVCVAILFAVSVPLSQGFRGGWEIMAGIVFRGTESFLAGLWLVNVIPFDQLLSTLGRSGVPAILLAILAFMYRFVFVLWDELDTMRAARRARAFDRGGAIFRWRTSVQMIGMLLIRSLGRSERVYGAMCARGWDGRLRTLNDPSATSRR
jgi:cobalt/nickel transport system permease protein